MVNFELEFGAKIWHRNRAIYRILGRIMVIKFKVKNCYNILSLIFFVSFLAVSCGKKGPLYLPKGVVPDATVENAELQKPKDATTDTEKKPVDSAK